MKKRTLATLAGATVLTLAYPGDIHAFTTRLGMQVNPVNAAVFEAVGRSSPASTEFWCAAGDYARRGLGAAWTAPVYVVRGRGPSETSKRRSAVQFTTDPAAAGITPVDPSQSLNSFKVGDNMSVQQAFSYCQTPFGLPI